MTAGSAEHAARERVQRVLYFACGIGAIVFGLLLLQGDSGVLASRDQLAGWYVVPAILISFVLPASYLALAVAAPMRLLHAIALAIVVGFLVIELLWVPAMTGEVLAGGGNPWIQGITALPSTAIGVLWRSTAVWAFPVSQLVLVPLIQLSASDTTGWAAWLDGCGALIFCSILTGMALAVISAADREDRVAGEARRLAAIEAAKRTRERELSRINAIVHDDVMSVLLTASRRDAPGSLERGARDALKAIEQISRPDVARADGYSAPEVVAALRAVPPDLGVPAHVDYTFGACPPVPAPAVAALAEALGEAVRNAARHAGDDADLAVTISAHARGVDVSVTDSGRGFDADLVDPLRLGIRVSIAERMAAVPGGRAQVRSHPGRGTTVSLGWEAP